MVAKNRFDTRDIHALSTEGKNKKPSFGKTRSRMAFTTRPFKNSRAIQTHVPNGSPQEKKKDGCGVDDAPLILHTAMRGPPLPEWPLRRGRECFGTHRPAQTRLDLQRTVQPGAFECAEWMARKGGQGRKGMQRAFTPIRCRSLNFFLCFFPFQLALIVSASKSKRHSDEFPGRELGYRCCFFRIRVQLDSLSDATAPQKPCSPLFSPRNRKKSGNLRHSGSLIC